MPRADEGLRTGSTANPWSRALVRSVVLVGTKVGSAEASYILAMRGS